MQGSSERLRDARVNAGWRSAQSAAEAFGWTISTYRSHENGARGFDVQDAKRYARAFKVNPGWLLGLDKIEPPKPAPAPLAANMVEVIGSVAAGTWVESLEWEPEERFTIVVAGLSLPNARRFGLRVDGHSMDRVYTPGTILDCVSVFDLPEPPQNDDHVIVERNRGDGLHEYTVKRLYVDPDGRCWLMPESSKPEHQTPIEIGCPDADHDGPDAVRIIALVIGSYQPRVSRLARLLSS